MIQEKKQPNRKNIIIFVLIGLTISLLISLFFILNTKKELEPIPIAVYCNHVLHANAPISPTKKLQDKNEIHLLHATKNGISAPFATNEDLEIQIDSLLKNNILIEIQSNDLFKIKRLRHSHPYLTPNTAQMLNEIATRFNEKIKEYKVGDYRIMLTSLLRTEETQNKLSKRNVNAASLSAHYFATTIDISYKDFYNVSTNTVEGKWEAIQALAKVLSEMREECKLLGLRENKQACFHITSVTCDPIQHQRIYSIEDRKLLISEEPQI